MWLRTDPQRIVSLSVQCGPVLCAEQAVGTGSCGTLYRGRNESAPKLLPQHSPRPPGGRRRCRACSVPGGSSVLLFGGFAGGFWAQNKAWLGGSAAAHVLFSPAALTSPFARHLPVCSVVEACSLVFQQSREEGKEDKTEDNLTTLFPGQKRRISHLVKQGNVSAAFRIWIL